MNQSTKTVALGYIGTGIAAKQLHWPVIAQLGNKFHIQAVCNRTRAKAVDFAELTGATSVYDTAEELLADELVEAVVIAAPIELNYSLVKQALQSNKHVLVEKPLAASLTEAKELVQLVAGYDKVALLAENFRYHKAYRDIAQLVADGVIGNVHSFFWNGYKALDLSNKYATAWRLKNQYPGGFVMDAGIHNVAAIRLMFGELAHAEAKTQSINPEIGTIDTLNSLLTFQSGVVGQLNLCFSPNSFSDNRLVVLGKKGTIVFQDDKLTATVDEQIVWSAEYDFPDSYKNQFDDFYHCITTNASPLSTFEQGALDLEFMLRLL